MYSKKPKYKKILKSILIWILEIAIVILSAYLIIEYAVEKTTMLGASMETTLKDGDYRKQAGISEKRTKTL